MKQQEQVLETGQFGWLMQHENLKKISNSSEINCIKKKTFSLVQQTFKKSVDLILKTVTFSFQM